MSDQVTCLFKFLSASTQVLNHGVLHAAVPRVSKMFHARPRGQQMARLPARPACFIQGLREEESDSLFPGGPCRRSLTPNSVAPSPPSSLHLRHSHGSERARFYAA